MAERNGSLSLPEFEDRLWDELAERHAAENGRPAAGRGGRRMRLAAAAAVVAVLAAAGGVAVALSSGGDDEPTDVATSPEEGEVATPADQETEEAAAESAVADGPPDAIVFVEQVNVDGTVDHRWTDETTGLNRDLMLDSAGNPEYESAWLDLVENEDGTVTVKQMTVDHAAGEYYRDDWTPPMIPGENVWPPASWREDVSMRDSVANGSSVEDGLEEVDGQELLRLVDAMGGESCATSDSGIELCLRAGAVDLGEDGKLCHGDPSVAFPPLAEAGEEPVSREELSEPPEGEPDEEDCVSADDLETEDVEADPSLGVTWVDPETYRPVKRIGYPGSDAEYTMTYEYLERTEENLGLLEPEIPAGFVETEPPVSDVQGMEAAEAEAFEEAGGDPSAPTTTTTTVPAG